MAIINLIDEHKNELEWIIEVQYMKVKLFCLKIYTAYNINADSFVIENWMM